MDLVGASNQLGWFGRLVRFVGWLSGFHELIASSGLPCCFDGSIDCFGLLAGWAISRDGLDSQPPKEH